MNDYLSQWNSVITKTLEVLMDTLPPRPVTLYGPDNKPIYLPTGTKIGGTITVRRPQRFQQ